MLRICIGLCGLTCSGKDTIADIFSKHGFKKYSYTDDVLVPVSKEKNIPQTRDAYRKLLNDLGNSANEILFEKIQSDKTRRVVIPNIRLLSSVNFWRRKNEFKFYLIRISSDESKRLDRYVSRKRSIDPEPDENGLDSIDKKDLDVNDLGKIFKKEKFDFKIKNNGDLEELNIKCAQILNLVV